MWSAFPDYIMFYKNKNQRTPLFSSLDIWTAKPKSVNQMTYNNVPEHEL